MKFRIKKLRRSNAKIKETGLNDEIMTFSKKQKERNKPKNLILLYLNLFYFISFF